MKQFLTLALVVGALMVSAPSQARMVSSRAQCVAFCDDHGSVDDNCGWITKRGKRTRCRAKLIWQCRRFGHDVMCPAPATTTTVPTPSLTTTTVPFDDHGVDPYPDDHGVDFRPDDHGAF